MKSHKIIVSDASVDCDGRLGGAIAMKHAARDGSGGRLPRRPLDLEFDEALLAELEERKISFGLTKACIDIAIELAGRLKKNISNDGARSRVGELNRIGKGRLRWREKKAVGELSTLSENNRSE